MLDRRTLAVLLVSASLPSALAESRAWYECGPCLISIGDLDGDGWRDLAVANRSPTGRECVWLISSKSGAILHRIEGARVGDGFGGSLAELGDVNGDGVSDLVVGAVGTRDLTPQTGADGRMLPPARVSGGYARLVSGKTAATLFQLDSDWSGEMDAFTVACGGDVDADGVPDVLVGDMHSESTFEFILKGSKDHGRVRVYSGANGGVLHALVPPPLWKGASYFGAALAAVGDVDRDGYGDFAVAAPFAKLPSPHDDDPRPLGAGEDGMGVVFVYSGRSGSCVRTLTGPEAGFGWAIAAAPDAAHAGSYQLAVTSRSQVSVCSTFDWDVRVIATSHCGLYACIDEFGSSLEFALDAKTRAASALVIGANEKSVPMFDEGYAEVYPLGGGEPLVLARDEKEGIDACALDDLDGDGKNDYACVTVKSMRVRVLSSRSGSLLREITLGAK